MAELDLELAKATARTALTFAQGFDGRGIDWQGDSTTHIRNLGGALDHVTELAGMVLNLSDRVGAAADDSRAASDRGTSAERELALYAKVYELLLSHPIRSAFREAEDGPEGEAPPTDPELLVAVQADRFDLSTAIRELRRKAQMQLFEGNFTDTARCALLWVLWHHQGGSSKVGEAMRFALGKGAHEDLNEHEIGQAKKWEALPGAGGAKS